MEQETADTILFFGRFHPLIVHLPIGFIIIALLLEALSRLEKFRHYGTVTAFVLLLGGISAAFAAALGYMLAQAGGYNENILQLHQWTGIAVAAAALLAFGLKLKLQNTAQPLFDKFYLTVMAVLFIMLSAAGHYGGSLTHGSDYLTQYMPNVLRKAAGMPPKKSKEVKITNLDEAVIYKDIVFPILDTKCISCHSESKSKGDLMMHTPEALMKGGENGPVFIAGNAAESAMIKMALLPEIDDKHMPPKGKSQLTDDEIKLIEWWINEGASFHKKTAEVKIAEEVQAVLKTLTDPNADKTPVDLLLAADVKAADEQKIAQLQKKAVKILPMSHNLNWLHVKVTPGYAADSLVSSFAGISEQLTWLDARNTNTTDNALSEIAVFKNLTRLHLDNTKITDNGLQHLKNLPYLEYLNLYGTQVSDKGIRQLSGLKNLKKLYVWQTEVTEKGAAELKKALPELEIYMGIPGTLPHQAKTASSLAKAEQ